MTGDTDIPCIESVAGIFNLERQFGNGKQLWFREQANPDYELAEDDDEVCFARSSI